nr:potassium-transporting ATPase F subunit [Actinosynnema pretiosum subsp. auranticum]
MHPSGVAAPTNGGRSKSGREHAHGRPGLRVAAHRCVRAARPRGARTGAALMGGTGVVANAVGGVLALLLIGYLFVALIRPEKF